MKIKYILFFIIKILIFSNIIVIFGQENVLPHEKKKDLSANQEIPRFKKITVIGKVKNYTPLITINEGVEADLGSSSSAESSKVDQSLTIKGERMGIAKFRLGLKDKRGKVKMSENKTVFWPRGDSGKANLFDVMGDEIKGVNISMERNPKDRDSLMITINQEE